MIAIGNDWDELLAEEFTASYYLKLREFLKTEYATQKVYPGMYDLFNALKNTPYAAVRVVLLGQDPYHGNGQAHGLCFSVRAGIPKPPSLVNIFRELSEDTGMPVPESGDLTPWTREGVLLLNTTLSVREGAPQSHKGHGWETFTDHIIEKLDAADRPMVFLLWGGNARSKKPLIRNPRHLILETVHPSPLSAYNGFFGCRHFSRANAFLTENGVPPVKWDSLIK